MPGKVQHDTGTTRSDIHGEDARNELSEKDAVKEMLASRSGLELATRSYTCKLKDDEHPE